MGAVSIGRQWLFFNQVPVLFFSSGSSRGFAPWGRFLVITRGRVLEQRPMSDAHSTDDRTPSPPYGYSCPCRLDREAQIRVVAQFHANHIRPNRIAYRMGIDIAFIEALIAGEIESDHFAHLVERYRRQRYRDRMRDSSAQRGSRRFELQQKIERDFHLESQQPGQAPAKGTPTV